MQDSAFVSGGRVRVWGERERVEVSDSLSGVSAGSSSGWVGSEFGERVYSEADVSRLLALKRSVFPSALRRAVDSLVAETGGSVCDVAEHRVVDMVLAVQSVVFEVMRVDVPYRAFEVDADGVELLFDDRECVYYTVRVPWSLESVLDGRVGVLSVGVVLAVMERATRIRARGVFGSGGVIERVEEEGTTPVCLFTLPSKKVGV